MHPSMETLWQIAQKINTERCFLSFNEPMALHTTFRIGGPADLYLRPRTIPALAEVMTVLADEKVPWVLLGGGANVLVGDRGIRGAVIDTGLLASMRLVREIHEASAGQGLYLLEAECGVSVGTLCEEALIHSLSGLEAFYGMPGSVGGAVYMNARCYEEDISAHLASLTAISPQGTMVRLEPASLSWEYKRSPFQAQGTHAGWTVAAAAFRLQSEDARAIAFRMREKMADRLRKHHFDFPSAGSVFKNNRAFGKPTGKLLDELGLRGFRIGDAMVSPWHANIFINAGKARACDMRQLIEFAQNEALAKLGLSLELEILFLGEF